MTSPDNDRAVPSSSLHADVVLLPRELRPEDLHDRTVIVFDVLRATTSIAAALGAGVAEIRVFPDIEAARRACAACGEMPRLLCGEVNCLPPEGFDLGNSPGAFNSEHAGRTVFMSTTNGTRAIIAAAAASAILTGALVNASAAARMALTLGRDVTLLCAGTNGRIALEDVLGAGAVLDAMARHCDLHLAEDTALLALRLFESNRERLRAVLADSQGGKNVLAAGLPLDIDFCARLDAVDAVGVARPDPLRIVRA